MPSLPSSSAESRIAKRYLLFSQCEITASWIAESVWPGAQTREISGMSLKTFRPVRRPGPSSLPMYSAGLGAAAAGTAEGAEAAAGLPPSPAFFDSASFFSASFAACSADTVLGETLQTKALVPPLLKNPWTACARLVECEKSPNVRVYCAQLVISTASLVGPTDDSPMNAAVEVPTASMGFEPRSTSSIYTPGDRYDVAMDYSLPFGGWRPHKGGGLAWEIALVPLLDDHRSNELPLCPGIHFRGGDTIFGGLASIPSSRALTLPGGGLS